MCIQLKQKQMRGKRCVTASRLFNQFSKVLRFLKAVLHRRSRDKENMKSEVQLGFFAAKNTHFDTRFSNKRKQCIRMPSTEAFRIM